VSAAQPYPAPAGEPLLRLRPLGLGEVLDDIFRVYRRHFGLLCGIALVLTVPGLLVQFASGSAGSFGFLLGALLNLGNPAAFAGQVPQQPDLVLFGLSYLVLIAAIPFTVGAVTLAAIDLLLGNPVTIRSALRRVARRYWGLLGLTGMYLLVSPLALCFPVLIWLAIRWVVAVPVMLAEGAGPIRGLQRSWELTRGSWWRLFGILLVMYLLQSVVSGALGVFALPAALLIPFVPDVVRGGILLTISTLAGALVLPVLYLCVVLMYFDLRVRREDFDLDQLARQAVGPPA
jgi:membrane-anchored glycerophosphoryl diester phosphodiesterase (GDPDase)